MMKSILGRPPSQWLSGQNRGLASARAPILMYQVDGLLTEANLYGRSIDQYALYGER